MCCKYFQPWVRLLTRFMVSLDDGSFYNGVELINFFLIFPYPEIMKIFSYYRNVCIYYLSFLSSPHCKPSEDKQSCCEHSLRCQCRCAGVLNNSSTASDPYSITFQEGKLSLREAKRHDQGTQGSQVSILCFEDQSSSPVEEETVTCYCERNKCLQRS